jgi:hypothetical protein
MKTKKGGTSAMNLQTDEVISEAAYRQMYADIYPTNNMVQIEISQVVPNDKIVSIKTGSLQDNKPEENKPETNNKELKIIPINNDPIVISSVKQNPNRATSQTQSTYKCEKELEAFLYPKEIWELKKTSANCYHIIVNDIFCKLQAFNYGDSLVAETYYTKVLTDYENNRIHDANYKRIFPTIVDQPNIPAYCKVFHNPFPPPNPGFFFQGLKTHAYTGAESLGDRLRSALKTYKQNKATTAPLQQCKTDINELLRSYTGAVREFGEISHNDLHLGNMLYDGDQLKFIDFGRMYINKEDIVLKEAIIKAFCYECNKDAISKHFNNYFQIKGPLNYMCDIATVALNTCPHIMYDWPEWCKIYWGTLNDGTSATPKLIRVCEIDFGKLFDNPPDFSEILHLGLAWFVCCVIGYQNAASNGTSTQHYWKIDFNQLKNQTMMFSNCVLVAPHYELYKTFTGCLFNQVMSKKIQQMHLTAQGSSQGGKAYKVGKTKIKTRKGKLMKGGVNAELKDVKELEFYKLLNEFDEKDIGLDDACIPTGDEIVKFAKKPPLHLKQLSADDAKNYILTKAVIDAKTITKNVIKANSQAHVVPPPTTEFKGSTTLKQISTNTKNQRDQDDKRDVPPKRGGSITSYKIVTSRDGRKYVRKSNTKWFLDENKGKYKYASVDKTHIVMRASSKKNKQKS